MEQTYEDEQNKNRLKQIETQAEGPTEIDISKHSNSHHLRDRHVRTSKPMQSPYGIKRSTKLLQPQLGISAFPMLKHFLA